MTVNRRVMISGCSGGGKSTLLAELSRQGFATVEEPGRRIVREEIERGGNALPWTDLEAFATRAIEVATADYDDADPAVWTFFDRGLVDACSALAHETGQPIARDLLSARPYNALVFLAPPWPEIYEGDGERRHGLDAALAEYERLAAIYPALGYETVLLPKVSVAERAGFVLGRLELG